MTLRAIQRHLVRSAHDLAEGGLAVALSEACIGNGLGADISLESSLSVTECLFSESQSRILLSVDGHKVDEVIALCAEWDVPVARIGTVTECGKPLTITVNGQTAVTEDVRTLTDVWEGAIPCQMNRSLTS